jgi:uncharacterized membrane protein YgaE (UPF0421/DUF939 family)
VTAARRWGAARAALSPRAALDRVSASAPAALQLAVAAAVSYAVARYALGHRSPLQAVTVALSSLGFVRDARPRRVLEAAAGLTLGIAVAEVVVAVAGTGVVQLGVVLLAALLVARLLGANPAVSVSAATVAAIVLLVPAPPGGPFIRSLDGLVGGATALLATALLPRDPARAALHDAEELFRTCRAACDDLVRALRAGDAGRAEAALEQLRGTQPLLDRWTDQLDSAIAVARISPFLRRHRPPLQQQRRVLAGMDLAIRSLRSVARRVAVLVADGTPRPDLGDLVGATAAAIDVLGRSLRQPELRPIARADLLLVAARLDPAAVTPDGAITESMLVVLARPMVVDLLGATGLTVEEARAALPVL